jgi:hypothetical protein
MIRVSSCALIILIFLNMTKTIIAFVCSTCFGIFLLNDNKFFFNAPPQPDITASLNRFKEAALRANDITGIQKGMNRNYQTAPWPAGFPNSVFLAKENMDNAHREIWRRFIDQYSVLIDYADSSGAYPRPTADEYRNNKPNALAWWTPTENGSMFNGLYLDGICRRWKISRSEEDRKKARTLANGLFFLASVGDTPGFIARSVATDGKTPPAMGSNDQSSPWFYGIWRYVTSGIPDAAEKKKFIAKMTAIAEVYLTTGWRIPATSYSPSKFRNSFASFDWEGTPRILFISKALYALTGNKKWNDIYLKAIHETGGPENKSRLQICASGMHFEKNKINRWTGVSGVVDLLALWEMEKDPVLRNSYEQGLNASAKSAAETLELWKQFDNNDRKQFLADWRILNQWWKPQHSEQDALDVAKIQHDELVKLSPRRVQELNYMREPIWMSWIVTMAADKTIVDANRQQILEMLAYFQYNKLYYSQFFPVEAIWFRLQEGR